MALQGVILLAAGCATRPDADPMQQQIEAAQRHSDVVLRQARAEANAQRAELAAARIAAAKQAAEVQELRTEAAELRRTGEAKQAEQAALRGERDRLAQAKNELQAQVGELAQLRQRMTEARAAEEKARVRVGELESALLVLSTELDQVKKAALRRHAKPGAESGKASAPPAQGTRPAVAPAARRPAGGRDPGVLPAVMLMKDRAGPRQVIVHRDETLWMIARRFGVTVDQVREANGLEGDLIIEGRTLVIPGR